MKFSCNSWVLGQRFNLNSISFKLLLTAGDFKGAILMFQDVGQSFTLEISGKCQDFAKFEPIRT
jgi:hypothetical protein